MKLPTVFISVTSLLWLKFTHAKIGYFWHITDFHYDPFHNSPDFSKGCRANGAEGGSGMDHGQRARHRERDREHACDSSWRLIESAAAHMLHRHPDTLEFVLWTGDILSSTLASATEELKLAAVRNVTDLLGRTFSSQFVFPALGHNDPKPSRKLTEMWMQWLPTEALQTFETGGYYTIEQSHSKLRIVTLNSNLWSGGATRNTPDGPQRARAQWDWLEKVLNKAKRNQEMVYLVAHTGPGVEERGGVGMAGELTPAANLRLLQLTRAYADVIAGQFYGHRHADTFRVAYSEGRPVSWALLAPSVTPRGVAGTTTNPGLRLYKFDSNTGKVLDYTQYYLDIASAQIGETHWTVEYNLTQYYGLREVTAHSLHMLAERLARSVPHDQGLFAKYIMARVVRRAEWSGAWECDAACVHSHYCAITRLDYQEYRACVRAPASALASRASSADNGSRVALLLLAALMLLLQ